MKKSNIALLAILGSGAVIAGYLFVKKASAQAPLLVIPPENLGVSQGQGTYGTSENQLIVTTARAGQEMTTQNTAIFNPTPFNPQAQFQEAHQFFEMSNRLQSGML